MVDGFTILSGLFGLGVQDIFGGVEIGSMLLVFAVIACLALIGVDIVVDICLGGLLALGLAYAGWLPLQITQVIVLIIWALGFAYFWIMFINR